MARLEAIKEHLHVAGYVPILLSEVPDIIDYDLERKLTAIGAVCRFIVIDDSSKSGHLVEYAMAKTNQWIIVIMRMKGGRGSYMTLGAAERSSVIREVEYSEESMERVISDGVKWAEEAVRRLRRVGRLYPWVEKM